MKLRPAHRNVRDWLGRLAVLGGTVLVMLALLEFLLRANLISNDYYVHSEVLGADGDGPTVFVIGDSFLAPRVGRDMVDQLFEVVAPEGVRIRNAARAGTGPLQYLQSLRREGERHSPDIVLMGYYVGNDLHDVGCGGDIEARLPFRRLPAWKRTYVVQFLKERLERLFPGRVFFAEHRDGAVDRDPRTSVARASILPVFRLPTAVQSVSYDAMREAGIAEEHVQAAMAGQINPWIVQLGVNSPDYYREELLRFNECAATAWADTQRLLDLIVEATDALGAQLLPVIFPHTFQINTAHYELYREWKINVDDEMLTTTRPQDQLEEYFRSRGVEPLDLIDVFRANGEMLYWEMDEHLNMRGQQLSAETIAEAILAR